MGKVLIEKNITVIRGMKVMICETGWWRPKKLLAYGRL